MDTFFEQIISIRKTSKDFLKLIGIWVLAFVLLFLIITFLIPTPFMSIAMLLCVGVLYGAYKLSTFLSVEYEYIVTNSTLDIDKIVARSSRKRELSCELDRVERLEKYNPSTHPVGNFKKTVMACDPNNPNAYFLVVNEEGKGSRLLVFAPDERLQGAIKKALPKFISNSAFKN